MIATMIYKAYLGTKSKFLSAILWKIRSVILKFHNPLVTLKYRGFSLKMPLSHTIFAYQKQYPHYDMALGKIARFIERKSGVLNIADIGANIGDTAVFIKAKNASFLLIEGSRQYANLIEENLKANYKNIHNMQNAKMQIGGGSRDNCVKYIIECTFISDKSNLNYDINLSNGSGNLIQSNSCNLHFQTLDEVFNKHSFTPNFIKIDTDGFDFKVIRSGLNFIKRHKPSLYFEWDRAFLEAQNENYLSIFADLKECGYKDAVIFDNFGSPLCILGLDDERNFSLLASYTTHSRQNIYYYDILLLGGELCSGEFIEDFYKGD